MMQYIRNGFKIKGTPLIVLIAYSQTMKFWYMLHTPWVALFGDIPDFLDFPLTFGMLIQYV